MTSTAALRAGPLTFVTLSLFLLTGVAPQAQAAGPTAEEVAKIDSAVPARAHATPAQPRRLLVFTLCHGYVHASIPYGAKAIELMGQKTGAFTATISDDIAQFEPETLNGYDAICLVSALGELFLPPDLASLSPEQQAQARAKDARLKAGLLAYLRRGKGLAAIHGASYAFYDWPEFGVALGGFFDSHPWTATQKIAVKLEDPAHPLLAAFQGVGFEIIDEGYQFKAPYSRAHNRVLYSLDPARMAPPKARLRPDHDFGLCWVRRYGQGRIFYSALGHNPEEYWNPMLLEHFLDGIQFALGDLAADTAPLPLPAAR